MGLKENLHLEELPLEFSGFSARLLVSDSSTEVPSRLRELSYLSKSPIWSAI